MDSLSTLLTVTGAGVTLHNALQLLGAQLGRVATAVESGNVQALRADAVSVAGAVQAHDPAFAATVAADARKVVAAAEADAQRARHAAADELRRLAAAVEHVASATALPAAVPDAAAAPAVTAPQAVDPAPASGA